MFQKKLTLEAEECEGQLHCETVDKRGLFGLRNLAGRPRSGQYMQS